MKKQLSILLFLSILIYSCVNRLISESKKSSESFYLSQEASESSVPGHVSQKDIEKGLWGMEELKIAGERLFLAQFTRKDGMGRPGATGNSAPTLRPLGTDILFTRTAGPDANSCFSCHRSPSVGGAGDFTVNVFAGLGARQPIHFSTDPKMSAERGTPELNGSGVIELLAREMTLDLHKIRDEIVDRAIKTGTAIRRKLITKGISFGFITSEADGSLRLSEVEGVDRDLVIRPWTQKGTISSLRTFTINATNLHHGMQASERFGLRLTGSFDFDRDGIDNELTEGDITAMVVFQASLNIPGQILPSDKRQRQRVAEGEILFNNSKCASCHIPELELNDPVYTEPGLYNLEGTLRQKDTKKLVYLDLTKDIAKPRLKRESNKYIVRAFTDLKRHRIADAEKTHFGNEEMVEGLTSTDEFLTRRLWAVGNTVPYGHRGDLMTIKEAILNHGGEGRAARLEFESISDDQQEKIIEFLRSLQVLPNGSENTIVKKESKVALPYMKKEH